MFLKDRALSPFGDDVGGVLSYRLSSIERRIGQCKEWEERERVVDRYSYAISRPAQARATESLPHIFIVTFRVAGTFTCIDCRVFILYTSSTNMAKHSALEDWATWALSPTISAILLTLLVALALPALIHLYLYRDARSKEIPTFLLVGPSGSGKTSLSTLVRREPV